MAPTSAASSSSDSSSKRRNPKRVCSIQPTNDTKKKQLKVARGDALNPSKLLLDPKFDRTFKYLFGTEGNKSIAVGFITKVTGLSIKDVTFLKPNQDTFTADESIRIVDILCELPCTKDKVLVEIQRTAQKNFSRRIFYYAAKIYSTGLEEGDSEFDSLKSLIVIVISDKGLEMKDPNYISCHRIQNVETKECYIDAVKFYFVDLSKFPFSSNDIGKLPKESSDVWFFYLKHIHNLTEIQLKTFQTRFPAMNNSISKLKSFNLSKADRLNYKLYCFSADPKDQTNKIKKLLEQKQELEEEKQRAITLLKKKTTSERILSEINIKIFRHF